MSAEVETLLADLKALHRLLSDRRRWTTALEARDFRGEAVNPLDPQATCFCLYGGIEKVSGGDGDRFSAMRTSLFNVLPVSAEGSLAKFNDGSRHEEVLALISAAAEQVREDRA